MVVGGDSEESTLFPGWKLSRINVGSAYLLSGGILRSNGNYTNYTMCLQMCEYVFLKEIKTVYVMMQTYLCHAQTLCLS